jgi:hypothetical protein
LSIFLGTISANGEKAIGDMIAEAMQLVGAGGSEAPIRNRRALHGCGGHCTAGRGARSRYAGLSQDRWRSSSAVGLQTPDSVGHEPAKLLGLTCVSLHLGLSVAGLKGEHALDIFGIGEFTG